jgi:anti-sigma factor RsiW
MSDWIGYREPACGNVLLVQAELDGELGPAEAAALEAHRAGCPICAAARVALLQARELVRSEAPETMPEAVRARVMARLQAAGAQAPGPRRRLSRLSWPSLRWPAFGFGLGAACAAALSLLIVMPDRESLTGEIVSDHIRALQPGHLEDVVSTDQHTVKPWFDGRIDFAPPVQDFVAQGFPLAGGRLDYLDGRQVAALVYRRDKHVINLFVWPSSGPPLTPGDGATQGYNIVHWREGGMNFWAVSDVERSQLNQFAALWLRHTP